MNNLKRFVILFVIILCVSSSPGFSQENVRDDFIYDLILASYFAEMHVDLATSSVVDDYYYKSLIRSSLTRSMTDEIFYYFRMNDKSYISYIETAPTLLAKTDYIYSILKLFR